MQDYFARKQDSLALLWFEMQLLQATHFYI